MVWRLPSRYAGGGCRPFWDGQLARFQHVETRAEFRRRGIGGTLIHHMAREVLASFPNIALVVEADSEDDDASRVYESLGFMPCERVGTLCQYDRERWDVSS